MISSIILVLFMVCKIDIIECEFDTVVFLMVLISKLSTTEFYRETLMCGNYQYKEMIILLKNKSRIEKRDCVVLFVDMMRE